MAGVVNAGRVELDVVAIARDQVSATLREVNKSLGSVKAKADEAAGGTRGLREGVNALTGGVKEGIKPLSQMREGFEQLRSNGLFVVGAVTAVGGALLGLIKHLTEAGSAQAELNARAKDFEAAGNALRAGIEALRERLKQTGDKFTETWDAAITGASEARLKLQLTDEALAQSAIKATRLRLEYEGFFGGVNMAIATGRNLGAEVEAQEKRTVALGNERKKLAGDIVEFERLNLEYLQKQNTEIGKQLLGRAIPGLGLALALGADKATGGRGKPDPKDPKPPGAGSSQSFEAVDPLTGKPLSSFREDNGDEAAGRRLGRRLWRAGGGPELEAAQKAIDDLAKKRAEEAVTEKARIDALAESYRNFANILRDGFDAALPGLGDAVTQLGELGAQLSTIDDANTKIALGASGTIKAGLDVAAANAKTAREAFTYKALGEGAAALGSLAVFDYQGFGLHTAAAAAYGIAAAAAGGGGGASSGGGGGRVAGPSSLDAPGSSRGNGGPVVNNIYVAPGTDPQTVGRELRRIEYSTRGTSAGNVGV